MPEGLKYHNVYPYTVIKV